MLPSRETIYCFIVLVFAVRHYAIHHGVFDLCEYDQHIARFSTDCPVVVISSPRHHQHIAVIWVGARGVVREVDHLPSLELEEAILVDFRVV